MAESNHRGMHPSGLRLATEHATHINGLLQTRSLRALRKLLLAFRSAAHMNDDEENTSAGGWKIEESSGMWFDHTFTL